MCYESESSFFKGEFINLFTNKVLISQYLQILMVLEPLPKGYISATIPSATWAVFESMGKLPEAIQDITRRIFSEWMPSTGYQHDCAPELEIYPAGDIYSSDYRCEVWIHIKK